MELLNGKETSNAIKDEIAIEVEKILENGGRRPSLTAILVGEDGASKTYVKNKEKACERVGFKSDIIRLPKDTTEEILLEKIAKLNADDTVDGFIVQLPLPKHINETKIINAIDPNKDVDGFHPVNVGKLMLGEDTFVSATPYGIVALLEHYGIKTAGKKCVVIGRSNIVGRPIANLLSQRGKDCTVVMCHSKTVNLKEETLKADIIIAAIGSPEFLKKDMIKEGVVIVDVGITRVPADTPKGYRLAGDVDFANVAPHCSYITPVPGGVGPMTIVSLMKNTLKAYKRKQK